MGKVLERVKGYFLGTKTREFYREERAWYREFETDPKDLRKMLRISRVEEGLDLFIGKIVPNIIDVASIAYSLIVKQPPYGIVLGEFLRLGCAANSNKRKKRLMRKIFQSSLLLNEEAESLKDLTNRLDNDGEEWKKY